MPACKNDVIREISNMQINIGIEWRKQTKIIAPGIDQLRRVETSFSFNFLGKRRSLISSFGISDNKRTLDLIRKVYLFL